ncbi:hypothetical protein VitviT2T_003632 [Vitis vinifera]|uniref:Sulfhydryl oxidase n=2 Tax=Vitis vinifera TaxID=29760 RepID=A0ABY9BM46_VITVI|eukprot:XP_002263818.2 PREDICTED: FAD-linked sulfhydryl oxidase ERV1 isoform X1 [Vitis vinifera]
MSETPFHPLFQTLEKLSHCIQNHLSNFIGGTPSHSSPTNERPHFSITSSSKANSSNKDFTLRQQKGLVDEGISANPVTKVELGRATWTFLHTLAAQFPDNPTRQQKKDVKELMAILSRMYPCKECADHFKEVLRANPVQAGSQAEFSQWLCHVHNVVNRSLNKPIFPCKRVDARWGKLDCELRACDLQGTPDFGERSH